MRALALVLAVALPMAVLVACAESEEKPQRSSGIEGLVLLGPQCAVQQAGSPCPDLPLEAVIEVYTPDGAQLIATVRSDVEGRFWVPLDPGGYLLVPLPPDPTSPLPAAGEQAVIVRPNRTTEVAISYDTGIR